MDSSSRYDRLIKGLKMHKRKNKKPLELVVNHILTCFQSHSEDSPKMNELHTILDTLAIQCPQMVSDDPPSQSANRALQQANRLKNLVKQLIAGDRIDKALELTNSSCPAAYTVPFLELKMQVYLHQRNMEEFWKSVQVLESEQQVAYVETYYAWGTSLKDFGAEANLQKSIDVFSKGISVAESDGNKALVEMMAEEKMKAEMQLKSHEAVPERAVVQIAPQERQKVPQEATQQAVEEAKRHEELLAAEAARIVPHSKKKKKKAKKPEQRKGIQILEVKKAVELEDESDERLLEEKKEKKGSGSKLVKESRPQKRKFEVALDVTMEDLDENSSMGFTKTNTTKVRKSFIVAGASHVHNIQELVDLCLTHENLLKIDQSFKPSDEIRPMLLTSENVCSIHCFFKRKWTENSLQSNEAWWKAIENVFWKVFRGMIRGLMYLFVKNKSCGDLVFNVFVTSNGEGRLLPSMEQATQKQDLRGLVDLMQSVIKLPNPNQSDLSFLPDHLNHFFDLIEKVNWFIPPEFLIDHPYFWNVAEKVNFIFKLRKLVKRNSTPLQAALCECKLYNYWWCKLHDVYQSLFDKAKKIKAQRYKANVDIVRYFAAVYTHVNEYEYKADRKHKRFTDEKIESDLARIFPNFYVDMFQCLCLCMCNKPGEQLQYADYMGLSTVSLHDK